MQAVPLAISPATKTAARKGFSSATGQPEKSAATGVSCGNRSVARKISTSTACSTVTNFCKPPPQPPQPPQPPRVSQPPQPPRVAQVSTKVATQEVLSSLGRLASTIINFLTGFQNNHTHARTPAPPPPPHTPTRARAPAGRKRECRGLDGTEEK